LKFSRFGQQLTTDSGIVTLMDDLGEALRVNPDMIFMGGGNPAQIPEAETLFRDLLQQVLDDPRDSGQMLGVYQPPQGDPEVLDAVAELLKQEYGWPLTRANIALANGSQSAFFVLFNLFAGDYADGSRKCIQLPLAPEYLGYTELGICADFFKTTRPLIEMLPGGFFKYHVDFSQLALSENTGALCVSRPTNPTGNVLTDSELAQLDAMAREHRIPLIIDGAYGTPFPNILFTEAQPLWNDNTVLVLSLSKLGLPGARTGIVVANPEVIDAFAKANTILSLACGNLGPAIAHGLMREGRILSLSRNVIAPFYRERMNRAGALAGVIVGGLTTIFWPMARGLAPIFDLYELVPGFILSMLAIVTTTLMTTRK
jgi:valine--pyruvate aminotransferase